VALCARVNGALAWPSGEAAAGQRRSDGEAMMAGWRAGGRTAQRGRVCALEWG